MKPIDDLLNRITMYKLVLYALLAIAAGTMILGGLGIIAYGPVSLAISLVVLAGVCYGVNWICSRLMNAPANRESALITALILFCILQPVSKAGDLVGLIVAGIIAMASKYLLAINRKHVFNPAAIAAFVLGFNANTAATWWVASPSLLPVVAVAGLLVVRKLRRPHLLIAFLVTSISMTMVFGIRSGVAPAAMLIQALTSWPLIFFGCFMLTEPLTTPPTKRYQIAYGAIVGLLFGAQFQVGPIYSTPELALVIGNVLSYIASPYARLKLTLTTKNKIADQTYEYSFAADKSLRFRAGQYMEWTLPHDRPDSRGNRRYFTVASSPSENHIKLGVRVPDPSSSFKKALSSMKPGDTLWAHQPAGDFTLNSDRDRKLAFIAGGIGITPFRSMIKHLIDKNESRDIVLFYASPKPEGFAYRELFEEAKKKLRLKIVYIVTRPAAVSREWKGQTGHLSREMLFTEMPDVKDRMIYISGPDALVKSAKKVVSSLVSPSQIHTDYFPGF